MSNIPLPSLQKRPTLQKGSRGAWVLYLQESLNECKKYVALTPDGDFGEHTLEVVKTFQQDQNLEVDGVVGENTWERLDKQPITKPALPRTGIAGADSLLPRVSPNMITEATQFLGTIPQFWGRYFCDDSADSGEYKHNEENNPLHAAGIRVLPICRKTNLISGTYQDGQEIGTAVVKDVLETFGEDYLASQGGIFYIFLDTEPKPQPTLSPDYYLGWSKAVVEGSNKVKFSPCVYLNLMDKETSEALSQAIDKGAECDGLWVASYYDTSNSQISPWFLEPNSPPIKAPVLIHQYIGDIDRNGKYVDNKGIYDFNQINPFLDSETEVLKRLILPQPVEVVNLLTTAGLTHRLHIL